jgi:hypothetical protein
MIRSMRKRILFATAVALFGCQYDPFAHQVTNVRPDESAVIGEYGLDRQSREMLQDLFEVEPPPAVFVLRADNSFTLADVPSCWRSDSSCSGRTESASGRWEIRRNSEWWVVQLTCDRIDGEAMSYGLRAMVRGDEPPYILHFTVGDPDAGEAIAFEKRL